MGLDMYLSVRKYASEYSGDVDKADIEQAIRLFGFDPLKMGSGFTAAEIRLTAIYWRKTNSVHNWFVKNCQNGIDECQKTSVSREQLEKLKSDCETVLAAPSKAKLLLPPSAGFFFGSTDLDEYYFDDLKYTVGKLKYVLNDPAFNDCDFEYQSSW